MMKWDEIGFLIILGLMFLVACYAFIQFLQRVAVSA